MVGLHGVLPPLDGALIRAALHELADRAWRAKHPDREPVHDPNLDEPLDRRLADALIEFFTPGGSGQATADDRCRRPRTTVVVTLGADSGIAEILGQGQVPLRTAFDLVSEPGVELYGALLGLNRDVLAIGKDRRFPTLLQRLAVILRDKHCVVPGCGAVHDRCEIHHLVEFQRGGKTVLANLALLCPAHHHFLHNNHYELRRGPTGYYVVDATGTTVIPP